MEQHTDANATPQKRRQAPPPPPVPELMRIGRKQLHVSLNPTMTEGSFNNWLAKAIRDLDFPAPRRTGARSVTWSVAEVQAWLASRPRKGTFDGHRKAAAA